MVLRFLYFHLIIALTGFATTILAFSKAQALDFVCGAALSGLNLTLLIWMGERTLYEKGIALTLLAGVGKYFVLLAVFVLAVFGNWSPSYFFIWGILSMLPSVGWISFKSEEAMNGSF